jgi:hypothetical protein
MGALSLSFSMTNSIHPSSKVLLGGCVKVN